MSSQPIFPPNGILVGRVWNADEQGPSVVVVRDGQVIAGFLSSAR